AIQKEIYMRKNLFIVATLIVFGMMLSACGPDHSAAPAPTVIVEAEAPILEYSIPASSGDNKVTPLDTNTPEKVKVTVPVPATLPAIKACAANWVAVDSKGYRILKDNIVRGFWRLSKDGRSVEYNNDDTKTGGPLQTMSGILFTPKDEIPYTTFQIDLKEKEVDEVGKIHYKDIGTILIDIANCNGVWKYYSPSKDFISIR
ncbi:MAG TPA: hypothetical protein VL401_04155, partial [Alphaproteobacteria bacterium]|nr:hypothetical protein [Alphaproteobacteria bacterium]